MSSFRKERVLQLIKQQSEHWEVLNLQLLAPYHDNPLSTRFIWNGRFLDKKTRNQPVQEKGPGIGWSSLNKAWAKSTSLGCDARMNTDAHLYWENMVHQPERLGTLKVALYGRSESFSHPIFQKRFCHITRRKIKLWALTAFPQDTDFVPKPNTLIQNSAMMLGAFSLLNTLWVGMTYPVEAVLPALLVKLQHIMAHRGNKGSSSNCLKQIHQI